MMQRHGFMTALAGLFVFPITIHACGDNQEACEKTGRCAQETGGESTGGGQEIPGCAAGSLCDDNNPCTEDRCDAEGICVTSPVSDSMLGPCGACVGGVLEPVPAQTLCDDAKVCDGSGECVGCDASPCPTGLTCSADSQCLQSNGDTCGSGAECSSGQCVDGVCCDKSCAHECVYCNGENPGTCEASPQYESDSLCPASEVCDGLGSCKRDDGATCTLDGHCASNRCVNDLCQPQ